MEDSKFQRKIEIVDSVVRGLIEKRGEISKKGLAIGERMVALAKEHEECEKENDKLLAEMNKLKLQILKIAERSCKKQMGDFESPVTTKIEGDKVFLYVANDLDEWKDLRSKVDPWKQVMPQAKPKK